MIMKPPTISFASANGPSVTPEAVTTLPEGFSLLPISRILSLNFSFHPLNAANISCICAGEGLFWLGAPRYMQRYFWVDIGFSWGYLRPSVGRHPKDARRGANRTPEKKFFPASRDAIHAVKHHSMPISEVLFQTSILQFRYGPGSTRVHAAPWVVICAAEYLKLQFPTRLTNPNGGAAHSPSGASRGRGREMCASANHFKSLGWSSIDLRALRMLS